MPRKTKRKSYLVSGVNGFWGRRVCMKLLAQSGQENTAARRIIGLDSRPMHPEIEGLEFIQAEMHDPNLAGLLKAERVEAVCHLAFDENTQDGEADFDWNVMGTRKVLRACADAGVRRVVLKSSIALYGAAAGNPVYFSESYPLQATPVYGYNRNFLENEIFCQAFRTQAPDLSLTIMRFPFIIGPEADTPMTRFLMDPLAPVLLGFDPLMQVIHENDVVRALVHALAHSASGVFNIAAEGVLPLSRLKALARKRSIPVFHPFAYWGVRLAKNFGLSGQGYWPIEPAYLRYACLGDLKKMHAVLDFEAEYTAEEALREFAQQRKLRYYAPGKAAAHQNAQRLYDALNRRQRVIESRE